MEKTNNKEINRLNQLASNLKKQPFIASSVEQANRAREAAGEKAINDTDDIHRLGAAVLRIEAIAERKDKEGKPRGKELLIKAATNYLVVKPEDIKDSYWQQQVQLARNEGKGDLELTDDFKQEKINEIQEAQKTSIELWSKHLTDGDKYPNWFKLYA